MNISYIKNISLILLVCNIITGCSFCPRGMLCANDIDSICFYSLDKYSEYPQAYRELYVSEIKDEMTFSLVIKDKKRIQSILEKVNNLEFEEYSKWGGNYDLRTLCVFCIHGEQQTYSIDPFDKLVFLDDRVSENGQEFCNLVDTLLYRDFDYEFQVYNHLFKVFWSNTDLEDLANALLIEDYETASHFLSDTSADINSLDFSGRTLLCWFTQLNRPQTVSYLLNKGARIDKLNQDGDNWEKVLEQMKSANPLCNQDSLFIVYNDYKKIDCVNLQSFCN